MSEFGSCQRRAPFFERYSSLSDFFNKKRKHLLRHLDHGHPFRKRIERRTGHLLSDTSIIDKPRALLSNEAIKSFRQRQTRKNRDPDNAKSRLQGSRLIQMWNAEYDSGNQWEEFDRARSKMEKMSNELDTHRRILLHDETTLEEKRERARQLDNDRAKRLTDREKGIETGTCDTEVDFDQNSPLDPLDLETSTEDQFSSPSSTSSSSSDSSDHEDAGARVHDCSVVRSGDRESGSCFALEDHEERTRRCPKWLTTTMPRYGDIDD